MTWTVSVAQFGDYFSADNLAEYESDPRLSQTIPRPDFASYSFVKSSAQSKAQNLLIIGVFFEPLTLFESPFSPFKLFIAHFIYFRWVPSILRKTPGNSAYYWAMSLLLKRRRLSLVTPRNRAATRCK